MNAPQLVRVMFEARSIPQPDHLITAHAGGWIDGTGLQAIEFEMGFRSRDEESGRQDKAIEPSEIHVTTIHHIEGTRLQTQFIQDAHIGLFSLGNRDKGGDGAAQIQQRVQLDRPFGPAETRLGKQIQAEVDGGGIQGIDRLLKFHSDRFTVIERASSADE